MNSWTKEEDDLLLQFYSQAESFKKWKEISDKFLTLGIQKTVYQCRQRYINKLDPTIKNQKWNSEEIQSLFMFYRLNGSKWQKMQKVLPQRTQGQLKNKFYSFLRSFILKALQQSKQLKRFKVNSISSKTIKRLFQGTQEFAQFSGKMTEFLEAIQYEISSQRIQQLLNKREYEIRQILKILFQNSKKPKSKEASQPEKHSILRRQLVHLYEKKRQNHSMDSEQESDSKNHSQRKKIIQQISEKNSSQNFHSNLKEVRIQSNFSQNGPRLQDMMNPWGLAIENWAKLEEGVQKQVVDQANRLEWSKFQYQFPLYSMENCMGRYHPQQDETIVSRQEKMFFYCMPFNGQQQFFYPF